MNSVMGTSILVVEDDRDSRQLLTDFLTLGGFEVQTAAHGAEALRLLDRTVPDVILLDLMLPWVNGVEVLATLRQRAELARVPVLVTTGTATSDFDLRAFRPVKVMRKPLDLDALVAAIQGLLLDSGFR
jgi:DNA-binding response OmpR family regulator